MQCTDCSRTVRPIVAVDIDGTLGKYHDHFRLFAEAYLGVSLPKNYMGAEKFGDYLGIERPIYRQIKLAYRQGGQKRTMPLYDGAKMFMNLLRHQGCEIWITTTRPYLRLDNIDPDTRHWLDRNDLGPVDGLLYDENKYQLLAEQVDHHRVLMVLDDLPEQVDAACAAFGSSVGRMVYRPHNMAVRRPGVAGLRQASDLVTRRIEEWRRKYG